jgi:hypothetical protein
VLFIALSAAYGVALVYLAERMLLPGAFLQRSKASWGWIHILGGTLLILAGIGIFAGQTWARVVGIIVAALAALANFAFLPYAPFWSMILITMAVLTIWGLSVWRPADIN